MNDLIKVLHVLGSLNYGGAENMIMNIYRNINRDNIKFDFIVHSLEKGDFEEEVNSLGGKIFRCPRFNGQGIFQYRKWWNDFFSNHQDYKILHSHIRSTASIYFPIAKKYGLKTIIHGHSTSEGYGFKASVKRMMEIPLKYQADYYIACSELAGKWLFGRKVLQSNKYIVLNNAIDLSKYKFSQIVYNRYRNKLKVKDRFILIHIGRFHESKNHDFLLDIVFEIKKKRRDVILLLVGNGDLKDTIEEKINRLNLNENVKLLGNREDIAELLICSDVFVFPSKWEGLPVSVIEAQASGISCYISKNITKEVAITDRVKFISIDDGCIDWVSEIIKSDCAHKDTTNQLLEAGYDINSSCEILENLYKDMM